MDTLHIIAGILQDGIFAAIAGVGFAAISNPPRVAYKYCALLAAVGHIARYCLTTFAGFSLVAASLCGAFLVGLLAIYIAPRVKCPPETFSYPALLPMIPGLYAYRCLQAFMMCMTAEGEEQFSHWFYLCESNGLTSIFVILGMVVGQFMPIMIFKRVSYSSTK